MGNALATADSTGRVSVHVQLYALNQMMLSRPYQLDKDFLDTQALVGLHWLPVFPQQQKVF
jgi:mediator of RNA polymerase II transcription subunit 16, fungi type